MAKPCRSWLAAAPSIAKPRLAYSCNVRSSQSLEHDVLSPAEKRKTLDTICAGRLHYLTDMQRKQVG